MIDNESPTDEQPLVPSSPDDGLNGYLILISLALFIWGGFWFWQLLDADGYIFHDTLTAVSSESWAIGEYKDCFSLNNKTGEPVLRCDNVLGGDKETVIKVRFYGRTHLDATPANSTLEWRCSKTGETDPTVMCEKR
jgi:hypothetical protein